MTNGKLGDATVNQGRDPAVFVGQRPARRTWREGAASDGGNREFHLKEVLSLVVCPGLATPSSVDQCRCDG